MNYTEITKSLDFLNANLQRRDEFIRTCAEILLKKLTGDDYGFPSDSICLQAVDTPIEDEKSYHPIQLPSDYNDGRRGFRVRFKTGYKGYLCGVVVLVPWVFSVTEDDVTAEIPGESATFQSTLDRPQAKIFIDSLAEATAQHIHKIICTMSLDPNINREMGFHSLNQKEA